jgi:hypothetical protein
LSEAYREQRHCKDCRMPFFVNPLSRRLLCDDCEALINPVFARQLRERYSWRETGANRENKMGAAHK